MIGTLNTKPLIAIVSAIVCIIAALATTALLLSIGDMITLNDILILALPILPYLILGAVSWRFRKTMSSSIVMFAGTMALSIFGVYIFFDTFVFSKKHTSTEALIILFVPVYQILGIVLLSVIAYLVGKFANYLDRRREARKL